MFVYSKMYIQFVKLIVLTIWLACFNLAIDFARPSWHESVL